ncbi:MAG: SLBB domain-containing protein [Ignavibacteria bacterium]
MNFRFFRIFILFILLLPAISFSQLDRQEVGNDAFLNQQGGFYNYGGRDIVNIYVNVWGYVKYPGKYLIPKGSTVQDLISYSGGPNTESKLEDIILYRPKNDSLNISSDKVINLDYNDLFWNDVVSSRDKLNPELIPGDVLILKGEPRYFARDNVNFLLSISAVLISLGILVVSIVRK